MLFGPLTRILLLEVTIAALFLLVGALANWLDGAAPRLRARGAPKP